MVQVLGQILVKIGMSLLTEAVIRQLLAAGLEQVVTHTDTQIDNEMLTPVIKALRGQ